MPVAAFPGRHGWGYDGVYLSAAHDPYGGPHGPPAAASTPPTPRASRCSSTSSTTTSAPPARRGWRRSARTSRAQYETPWGRAMNYDDADSDAVREWVLQSAEQWIRDFHLDGLRLDAIHSILDSSPEHLVAAVARRVHRGEPRRAGHRRVRAQRPEGARRLGLRRRLGRRLPPRAARAADRRPRRLLRGVRHARRAGQGAPPPALPRRHVLDVPPPPLRRARRGRSRRSAFVVFSSNHDQVGNRALGDRLPAEARPLAALLTLLAPFTPMLFQGEEHGERAPFQFFSDHIDEEIAAATREGRRREFAAFAEFAGEEVPDPQDAATFERLQAHARGRAGRPARPLRARCCDAAPRAAARRRRPDRLRRARGLAARRPRARSPLLANFSQRRRPRAGRAHAWRSCSRPTARRSSRASWSSRRSLERCSSDSSLARPRLPARRDVGRGGHELLPVLRARRARRAVPVRRRRQRDAHRADRAHRLQLARLPAGRRPRPALRLPRARALRARGGPPLQPAQAADRPVREVDRGQGPLEPRQRAALRPDRGRRRRRRPRDRRRGLRRRDPEVASSSTRTSTGRATGRPTRRCTRRSSTRRTSRASRCATRTSARTCAAPTPASPTRRRLEYLKELGVTAVELLPVHHIADESFLAERGLTQLLGLLDDRLLRAALRATPRPASAASRCASSRAWSRRCTARASR